jgi:peptide/nickel transport system permease protein
MIGRLRIGAGGAFVIVGAFFFAAAFGPLFAPDPVGHLHLEHPYELPSATFPLGTGDNGIDLMSALLHGARLALVVGFWVVGISLSLGSIVGIASGYYGGRADQALMGLADMVQAIPAIVLNIAILAVVASPGLTHLILALAANGWVIYARVARASTLSLRGAEFVAAAKALGFSDARVLLRHVLPNVAGPLVVQATAGFGWTLLAESTLSFLGLGPGKETSWGALLDQGSAVLLRFPHVALVSGSAIALTVLGFNLSGDRLRDLLDPRSARR